MTKHIPVAIVGAGPYGLSIAAHLSAAGIETCVFGDSMQTWREGRPRGMVLKSEGFASSLSDPGDTFTLGHYCRERDLPYADVGWPVPVEVFAAYGEEFARRFVPHRDARPVIRVSKGRGGFLIETQGGGAMTAGSVVLATGIAAYAQVPDALSSLPESVLTHSSNHADYAAFAGQEVAVIGAGASALDAAAALRRSGALVTLVSRRAEVRFHGGGRSRRKIDALLSPLTPLGPGWKKWLCCRLPSVFHALPEQVRLHIVKRYLGPAPASAVREVIEGHVPYRLRSRVAAAAVTPDGRVALTIERAGSGLGTMVVDHVLAATGYKVDVDRLGLLDPTLASAVATLDRSPALSRNFESSVPGLFFVGTPSAYSFGPMFRFACGAGYTARRLTTHFASEMRAARRAPTVARANIPDLQVP